jgi:hypothetical protein
MTVVHKAWGDRQMPLITSHACVWGWWVEKRSWSASVLGSIMRFWPLLVHLLEERRLCF